MAEFVTVMKEYKRMCEQGTVGTSFSMMCQNPEEAEKIIMKWSAEHPPKTLRDRFFELFPNAPKNGEGNPRICPSELGLTDPEYCNYNCEKCWSAEWEGAES